MTIAPSFRARLFKVPVTHFAHAVHAAKAASHRILSAFLNRAKSHEKTSDPSTRTGG